MWGSNKRRGQPSWPSISLPLGYVLSRMEHYVHGCEIGGGKTSSVWFGSPFNHKEIARHGWIEETWHSKFVMVAKTCGSEKESWLFWERPLCTHKFQDYPLTHSSSPFNFVSNASNWFIGLCLGRVPLIYTYQVLLSSGTLLLFAYTLESKRRALTYWWWNSYSLFLIPFLGWMFWVLFVGNPACLFTRLCRNYRCRNSLDTTSTYAGEQAGQSVNQRQK